jgi:MSHA biogenesis protein MshQ
MLLRRLYLSLLALMLFAAGGPASAGTTYTFGGGTVAGCTLSGAVYTCASLPLPAGDDSMVIASGYTVRITSGTTFDYNQSLTMRGNAVLSSTGDLDIGGIATGNLHITGGTLIAGATFSVGAQNQTLTADVQAVTANIGTGSQLSLTGNVTATGTVNVASHATINGTISGATVTTSSPVTLKGDVVATRSFTLASGSTVKGDVTAPVVSLLASSSTVTGNITATTSLQLGSSVAVTGDVKAGTLTLDSSEAIINGNATIASGVFNWHGRVTQTIYCSGGTATGRCDCVTNNSGYDVNTANGPHCQGNATALDHFLIAYDPTGSVCAPSTVTITACANAACTATYGGGANVTLAPTGQAVAIPASGSVQAAVQWTQTGINTLAVSGAATACIRNDHAPGANCQVDVASSAYTMTTNGMAFYAEAQAPQTTPTLTLAAVHYDAKSKACTPLFNNTTRTVNFKCYYANPTTGTVPVRLNGKALNDGTTTTCDNNGVTLSLPFGADGTTTLPMQYADAGAVTVKATDSGTGSPGTAIVTTTFVPAKLKIALAGAPYVAGTEFTTTVTAQNSVGGTTANFGRESPAESITLAAVACQPNNNNGLLATTPALKDGVQTFKTTWSETGNIDLVAHLASDTVAGTPNYLGTSMGPVAAKTNVATTGCTGAAGTFSPAYFTFDVDPDWKRTASTAAGTTLQYYSGEPAIKLTVTARNAQNGVTQNYTGANAHDLIFTAIDPKGGALAGVSGKFSRSTGYPATDLTSTAQIRALDFGAGGAAPGTATWTGSFTFNPPPTSPFSPTAPAPLRVRVSELPSLPYPASSSAIPVTVTAGVEPTLLVRSGRVRVPSRFGAAATLLKIPVSLEYYTGQTWVLNAEDSTTVIPAGAVSVGTGMGTIATGLTAFANGTATLTLAPPAASGRGSIPFALNLGSASANTSCFAGKQPMTPSTGAALPFLRSADASCTAAGLVDPSAMATFGVYAPETKRIIHTREVFR